MELDEKVIVGVVDNSGLDKEKLIELLHELGELFDLEELVEVATILDK